MHGSSSQHASTPGLDALLLRVAAKTAANADAWLWRRHGLRLAEARLLASLCAGPAAMTALADLGPADAMHCAAGVLIERGFIRRSDGGALQSLMLCEAGLRPAQIAAAALAARESRMAGGLPRGERTRLANLLAALDRRLDAEAAMIAATPLELAQLAELMDAATAA